MQRVFDETDPAIKADLNAMILQYLQEENLLATATTIQDELATKASELVAKRYDAIKICCACIYEPMKSPLLLASLTLHPSLPIPPLTDLG